MSYCSDFVYICFPLIPICMEITLDMYDNFWSFLIFPELLLTCHFHQQLEFHSSFSYLRLSTNSALFFNYI